jgi:GTP-binding protein
MSEDLPEEPFGSVQEWATDSDLDEYDEAAVEAVLDRELGAEPVAEEELPPADTRPVVAVVGRPNVGKSTLVNRVLGRREAVVQDVPGVTRDRVFYPAHWAGTDFLLVDTGGWVDKARGMSAQVAAQAERAAAQADVVVLVVDATVGATDEDEAVVRLLRRAQAPVILVANKVDDARTEADAAVLWSLGIGMPYPISALHGRGSGDLLDAIVEAMPEVGRGRGAAGPHRVALVGKPNVGKSSLLNRLAGEHRSVVDATAGTTVDPVDELVQLDGEDWLFVDTAGIRRRVREASGHEYYASLRTRGAIGRSEVAVVLLDASEPLTDQDLRIIGTVVEAGRGLVLAFNKWDLLDDERRRYLEREIDRDLAHVSWAPRVNVSAQTGRRVDAVAKAVRAALTGWQTRVPTGRLNAFFKEIVAAHPHPVRGGKQPRILFGTQASVAPPTVVLFTTGVLEAQYRRFLERRLREEFGFVGTPIIVNQRVRTKRGRR